MMTSSIRPALPITSRTNPEPAELSHTQVESTIDIWDGAIFNTMLHNEGIVRVSNRPNCHRIPATVLL